MHHPDDPRSLAARTASAADTIRAWRERVAAATEGAFEVAEPGTAYRFEVMELPVGPPPLLATAGGWAIRVPEAPREASCARCRGELLVAGPTGFRGGDPVCDPCLLEASPPLGMVLALVAVTRAYGALPPAAGAESEDALQELGAFARIYERFAAESGPAREFAVRRRPA